MRKLMMALALAVVLVPLLAAVALAQGQLIQCTTGGGFDKINVADDDTLDTANGGKGRDRCIVDAKKEAGTSCAAIEVPNQ
jgi:hypothetical protein